MSQPEHGDIRKDGEQGRAVASLSGIFESRITRRTITIDGSLVGDLTTHVEIVDEASGGESVLVTQPIGDGRLEIHPDEWPMLRATIDQMVKACRRD